VSKFLNLRRLGAGNFEYDPTGCIYDLLHGVYTEYPDKFNELLDEIIRKFSLQENDEKELNRFLSVFNLEVNCGGLAATTGTLTQRREDRHFLFQTLEAYPAEYNALRGAIERYAVGGTDALRQCLDSCRNCIENLIKKLSGENQWTHGLKTLMKSETDRKQVIQISQFLSARGVHGSEVPSPEDTAFGLKLSEDCLVWILKKVKKIVITWKNP
jgi:hypothetical protein